MPEIIKFEVSKDYQGEPRGRGLVVRVLDSGI